MLGEHTEVAKAFDDMFSKYYHNPTLDIGASHPPSHLVSLNAAVRGVEIVCVCVPHVRAVSLFAHILIRAPSPDAEEAKKMGQDKSAKAVTAKATPAAPPGKENVEVCSPRTHRIPFAAAVLSLSLS